MLVRFKRGWFGPDGHLYGQNKVDEVPEHLRDQLPSDTKIEGEDEPAGASFSAEEPQGQDEPAPAKLTL